MRLLWVRSMRAGAELGCHQMPERSFFFRRYQFPVCSRCCGVLIGEILAVILALKKKTIKAKICFASAGTMFFDWAIQFLGIKESNNIRRFISGVLGGLGCWSLFIHGAKLISTRIHEGQHQRTGGYHAKKERKTSK